MNYWDTTVQVSGSDFTTTSATLVDITGLTYAALANSLYEVEVVLRSQSTSINGNQYGWNYSAAGASSQLVIFAGPTGLADVNLTVDYLLATASSSVYNQAANANGDIWLKGLVKTGANPGNITIQVLKTAGGTATVYIGSIMKIKKLA